MALKFVQELCFRPPLSRNRTQLAFSKVASEESPPEPRPSAARNPPLVLGSDASARETPFAQLFRLNSIPHSSR
jgi:hypothetical protein